MFFPTANLAESTMASSTTFGRQPKPEIAMWPESMVDIIVEIPLEKLAFRLSTTARSIKVFARQLR